MNVKINKSWRDDQSLGIDFIVSAAANPRMSQRANTRRSTLNPINTKKMGTKTVLTGCNRSFRSR